MLKLSGGSTGGPAWRVDALVGVLAMVTGALPVFLVGTLAVEIQRSLHFGAAALGLAVTLYYLGAALFAIPAGILSQRIGPIRVMRLAALVGAVILALLAEEARSWPGLAMCLIPLGMVSASLSTATGHFLTRYVPAAKQGLAFGVGQGAVPLASMLGAVAVPALALTVGWRWSFALAALGALGVVAMVHTRARPGRASREAFPSEAAGVDRLALALLSAGLGLGVAAPSSVAAFVVTAGVEIHFDQSTVGVLAALASACAVVARVGMGFYADRRQSRRPFLLVVAMLGIGTVGYVMLAVGSAMASRLFFAAGALIVLGIGWGWNGLFNFALVRGFAATPAKAIGVSQVGGRLGGVVGPFAFGLAATGASYAVAWMLVGAMGLASAAAVYAGQRRVSSKRMPAAAPPVAVPPL